MTNDDTTCGQCGQVHTGCMGHYRRIGRDEPIDVYPPCPKTPREGSSLCPLHGLQVSNMQILTEQVLAEMRATKPTGFRRRLAWRLRRLADWVAPTRYDRRSTKWSRRCANSPGPGQEPQGGSRHG